MGKAGVSGLCPKNGLKRFFMGSGPIFWAAHLASDAERACMEWAAQFVPSGYSDAATWVLAAWGAALTIRPGLAARIEASKPWRWVLVLLFVGIAAFGHLSHLHEERNTAAREAQHDSDVGALRSELDSANGKLNELVASVTQIAQTPASTKSQTIAIMPTGRHLSDSQKSILIDRLSVLRGRAVHINASMDDSEAVAFAFKLLDVFQTAHVDVGNGIDRTAFSRPPPPLSVTVWTTLPIDSNAREIQDGIRLRGALIAAGMLSDGSKIIVEPHEDLFGHTHKVEVTVGPQAR